MKTYLNRTLLFILFLGIIFSCNEPPTENPTPIKPKYIFFFVGDGMGANHVSLSEAFLGSADGIIGMAKLNMTNFPYFGLCSTYSGNSNITDSGAAGSALACGEKAENGVISFFSGFPDENEPKSIAKIAHDNNFKVGIISTVSIDHATPAAYYASNESRSNYYNIGLELHESNFEFFGGGGFKYPTGENNSQTDLYSISQENGYTLSNDLATISSLNSNDSKVLFTNPVTLWSGEMPYAINRDLEGGYALCDIVESAIDFLDNDTGFFMMVEGGKIDWASHSNDAATIVGDVQDFDNAIQKAYQFYMEHPYETLIIVTADHETGGLALGNNQTGYTGNYSNLQLQACSMGYFATKIKEYKTNNTTYSVSDVEQLALEHFLTDTIVLTEHENAEILSAYNYYFYNTTNLTSLEINEKYASYNPVAVAYTDIINTRSAVSFTTWSHTGTRVPVYSIGQQSALFSGGLDNTDFHRIICDIMEW